MAYDVGALLKPVSDDQKAGRELDSATREAIEAALEEALRDPGLSRRQGEAAPQPDEVLGRIEEEMSNSKDIRLGQYLTYCGLWLGDFDLAAAGVEFIAGLLENMWDEAYPSADSGLRLRANVCNGLGRNAGFGKRLLKAVIWRTPTRAFTGQDLYDVKVTHRANTDGAKAIRAAVAEIGPGGLVHLPPAFARFRAGFERIKAAFAAHAPDSTPSNGEAKQAMTDLEASLQELGVELIAPAAPPQPAAQDAAPAPTAPSTSNAGGAIASRADVQRALDDICKFYEANEPGSPIPLALGRVRKWVTMSFMDVLREIAPNGVNEAENVLGKRQDPSS